MLGFLPDKQGFYLDPLWMNSVYSVDQINQTLTENNSKSMHQITTKNENQTDPLSQKAEGETV